MKKNLQKLSRRDSKLQSFELKPMQYFFFNNMEKKEKGETTHRHKKSQRLLKSQFSQKTNAIEYLCSNT